MSSQPHHSISIIGKRHVSNFTFVLRSVLSLGVVYVLCQLCCGAAIFLKTSNCELWEADCVVVEDEYKNRGLYRVRRVRVSPTLGLARYTRNGHVSIADTPYGRFIYDYKAGRFVSPVYQPALGQNLSDAVQSALQRSEKEEATALYESRIIFGENSLGVKLPTNAEIIKRRVFEKIFLWELFSIVVWILINYTRYVAVVGNIYLYVFIKKIVRDIGYRNEQRTSSRVGTVRVVRNGAFADVLATDVYPGDIIGINLTDKFECDAVILEGDAISDESYLTGEAVPICKGPRAVVYAGTRVIKSRGAAIVKESGQAQGLVRVKNLLRKQTDSSLGGGAAEKQSQTDVAIGLVIKTGKKTKSGLMLTSVLVRKPASNVFSEQSNRIIMQLLAATCAIMVLLFAYLSYTIPVMRAVRYALDLAIAFFSPALFSAWEIGIEYSCNELKKQGINTTDIRRINTAGEVDMVVFDKTGTLTEIGVDILCFDTIDRALERFGDLDPTAQLGFSTCHNVMELDGDYSGDILDMKMFQFSGAALCVGDKQRTVFSADDDAATEVERIYDFDSNLKRMSVVVRAADGQRFVFCKGAPDALARVLEAVPPGYHERVGAYGLQGHRVIALATRPLASSGGRGADEARLRFCGFVVFENRIKGETRGVVGALRAAGIAPRMCTGDSILTAISVARECGMVGRDVPVLFPVIEGGDDAQPDAEWYCVADEDYIFDRLRLSLHSEYDRATPVDFVVACEGREYAQLQGTAYQRFLLERGAVFARFTPENKKRLIEDYAGARLVTMYCGDGANDTGALAAADVGLSLATNEASLAASFNAVRLGAAVDLIKQGRSSLAMSIQQFEYLFYAQVLCGVQMVSLLLFKTFPSDMMSLVTDLMSVYILGSSLLSFKAADKIHKRKVAMNLNAASAWVCLELVAIACIFIGTSFAMGFMFSHSSIRVGTKNATATFFTMVLLEIYKAYACADFGPHRQTRGSNKCFNLVLVSCLVFFVHILLFFRLDFAPIRSQFMPEPLARADWVYISFCVFFSFVASAMFNLAKRHAQSKSSPIK